MRDGFQVDPNVFPHAIAQVDEAHNHFAQLDAELGGWDMSLYPGQFTETKKAMLGGHGDAGVFYGACERFARVFAEELGAAFLRNRTFVASLADLRFALSDSQKLYLDTEDANSGLMSRINRTLDGEDSTP